jgi:hypothetical protein
MILLRRYIAAVLQKGNALGTDLYTVLISVLDCASASADAAVRADERATRGTVGGPA